MEQAMATLSQQLETLSREWLAQGLPSREQVARSAQELIRRQKETGSQGLWSAKPSLLTATLDDGIGQGIEIIHLFAEAMGMQIIPLGLVRPAEVIVTACHEHRPDYVGLTVLQLDSEEELARVGHHLPAGTCLIAGGPAFRHDPDMAHRCGVHYVAANVACFIDYVLKRAVPQEDEEITAI
jgi:methylmalonyl-CoA mutase cobalamin-binding subunit